MVRAGWSPSVRLFEAAACGVPIVSDPWAGLDHFFRPGEEILIARSAEESLAFLSGTGDEERGRIGARARRRVLKSHTAATRAAELEEYALAGLDRQVRARGTPPARVVGSHASPARGGAAPDAPQTTAL
jgi:spore maturation protein CgeB